jgi:hypothetical protein
MKGARFKGGFVLAVVCCLATASFAAGSDVTDQDRSFRDFTRDAATVGDKTIRLEVKGFHLEDNDPEITLLGFPVNEIPNKDNQPIQKLKGGQIELLGSYGLGDDTEMGFDIPFLIQSTDFKDGSELNDTDISDVQLYGKFKRSVAKNCTMAAGLELTLPTGPEKKSFGTGELGLNPFLSTRYQHGRIGLGAHVGYQVYQGTPDDVFNFSTVAFARGSEHYLIRLEVAGRYFKTGGRKYTDVSLLPGIDFNLNEHVIIRPTGLANLTHDSLDWGLGLGIVLML